MTDYRYGNVAIILHWCMMFLLIISFGLGWYMEDLEYSIRGDFIALHKNIGLTLLVLLFVRLSYRLLHTPVAFHDSKKWQRIVASYTHLMLYVTMLLQPLLGYLSASFSGYKTKFWGIPLPHWGYKNTTLNDVFSEAHEWCGSVLLLLIALHVAGAFFHQIIEKKPLLSRMWFR